MPEDLTLKSITAPNAAAALIEFLRRYTSLWCARTGEKEAIIAAIEAVMAARFRRVDLPVDLYFARCSFEPSANNPVLSVSLSPIVDLLNWATNDNRALTLLARELGFDDNDHVLTVGPGALSFDGIVLWRHPAP